MSEDYYPPLSASQTGLAGKCPRCGRGALFEGYLGLKDHCPSCGLDYSTADSGDGPAVFVMFITGFVGVAVAFILRFGFDAPIVVAFGVSILLIALLTAAILRPMKGVLVALQYKNKAQEGRLE
ncbi:DUF983 domain-containing protein [Parvularcula sp. LCG005]|uniref:DUF983 domain-containing protein n=1 Tax=Parvularcula sp. LCG005 TaxID=3078805 RepID=UPI0029432182|nr:DUF983 domain-containing protein [Parvularcula sp. LCG005]WOI52844.1 DUF983 domain-containing protein [Parvularcula sp. LCG005]